MKILRTPDASFDNLEDYPFAPHYLEVGVEKIRMHYVEEGPADGPIILLLHGEPSWSYLYRKMIPILANAGYRTLAPDLIGFGKSDKPAEQADYTYARHLAWLGDWVRQMDLQNIILFCQDWGGLLGLRILAAESERFQKIVVANTALPTGNVAMPQAFTNWVNFSKNTPTFHISQIIDKGTVSTLSPAVLQAYDAPFPDDRYKAGARIFPSLVPVTLENPEALNNQKAWGVLATLKLPMLTLFSDSDPITKGVEKIFQQIVPGTKGQAHNIIEQGGHFLQEDKGEEIAQQMLQWLA